jgi:hypothetical protein
MTLLLKAYDIFWICAYVIDCSFSEQLAATWHAYMVMYMLMVTFEIHWKTHNTCLMDPFKVFIHGYVCIYKTHG